MSIESQSRVETKRPSRRAAAASPTALSNLAASGMLVAGFFLPHSIGCDNRLQHPITIARDVVSKSTEASDLLVLAILWPYAFAALTPLAIALLVLTRPSWIDLVLIGIPLSTTCSRDPMDSPTVQRSRWQPPGDDHRCHSDSCWSLRGG